MIFRMVKYGILFLFLSLSFGLEAKEIPPKPNPPKLVNDFAGVMNRAEVNGLEKRLVAYADSTSTQIAVVIEQSLEGDDVFEYSFRLAEAWGIGEAGKSNGMLIYIAIEDRKLFIHVGPGLQGVVTDGMTNSVIENIIKPNFKDQKYYNGLVRGTNALQKMAEGEFKNDNPNGGKPSTGFPIEILFFLGILIFIIWMNQRGNDDEDDGGGYYRGGQYDYNRRGRSGGWIFFPGSFGGGGGSGGFGGGGGFGGFGGGGFDGGGAGGSW